MSIADEFHKLYYDSKVWERTRWSDVIVSKNPMDLVVLQEIIWDTRPDIIIETGTFYGGSALFMAQTLDKIGHGYVLTIDIKREPCFPNHHRIVYAHGASTDPEIIELVKDRTQKPRVMVILDSDHSKENVLKELEIYAPLVTPGQYLIVEDTNVNGHPVLPEHGPGPMEAVEEWRHRGETWKDFEIDREREKFMFTFNPGGYLRRK